ncbi:AI-2E family transporter [Microlunatus elymi]|uniref:AI-2E family transporter n=1 Tax=Microlunatus elymi TaxID=2596828 RepID=A0A516Q036_9ACTN|nr:AI-2E family transporter [Microlunatus elymi]QDP96799.1 AI-2E family transporter [Microlunatus elymi]
MSEVVSPRPARSMPRGLLVLLGLAAAVVIVAGMKGAADILSVVFLTLVLTIAVHPLQRVLARHIPPWLATLICLIVVYLGILGLASLMFVSAAQFAGLLPQYEDQFDNLVGQLSDQLAALGIKEDQLHAVTAQLDLSKLTKILTSALSGVLGVVSNLVFIITLLLFMTVDGSSFPRHMVRAAGTRPTIINALLNFARASNRYLLVSTIFGAIVAVIDTIALLVMDIPAPLLWGLLAFLTNYIPNVGFVIGLVPPAILGLLAGGPGLMLAVVIVYCVINVIIQSVIQPKVVGDAVGLSTTLTFLSLIFWAWVLGPIGAILAIPLSLLVRAILVDADPDAKWMVPLVANSEGKKAKSASGRADAGTETETTEAEDGRGAVDG